jgi:hypothetical protein
MKLKICIITTLFILLSATLSQTVFAQNTKKQVKVLTQDERDKSEVTKFAKSFVESFLKIQDIRRMPERFFAKNFNTNFSKSNFDIYDDDFKNFKSGKLSSYNRNALFANFFALLIAVASLKNVNKDDDNNKFSKILPAKLLSEFRKIKWLKPIIDDDFKNYPAEDDKNLSEDSTRKMLVEIEKDISNISTQMRAYLNKLSKQNSKNLTVNRAKQFKYYPVDLCKAEKCLGLPENTSIFSVHELLLCLRIARINGRLKIVQVYSVAMED